MTTAQVVETSVTVNNNSPIQDYVHLDNQTQPTFEHHFIYLNTPAEDMVPSRVGLFDRGSMSCLVILTSSPDFSLDTAHK